MFGTQAPVTVRTAVPCDTCEASGAAPGTHPETCPECGGAGQVRRVRQSILGQMVTAAPCTRCGGHGQIIAQAVRRLPGRGPTDRAEDLHGRHPGRGRHRLDAAARRPRRGRVPGRRPRRPLRPRAGATARPLRAPGQRPRRRAAHPVHPGDPRRRPALRDPRRRGGPGRAPGHRDRAGVPPPRPGRAPRAGPRAGRPAGAGGRGHARRTSTPRRRTCSASSPRSAARRSRRRTPGFLGKIRSAFR